MKCVVVYISAFKNILDLSFMLYNENFLKAS